MSGKCDSSQYEVKITDPPPKDTEYCQDGNNLNYNSKTYSDLVREREQLYSNKFYHISKESDPNRRHGKTACLLTQIMDDLKKMKTDESTSLDKLKEQRTTLKKEEIMVKSQKNKLDSSENRDLVAKYRNEGTQKRNKNLNTYFTVYVTFIVFFLVIEGIVFFV